MKILIWNDSSQFVKEFVKKLRKERHEVYLLYNEHVQKGKKVKSAYEEYYLDYQNKHILTILQNISPEVCMFLTDPMQYINDNESYVSYMAGITNAVISAKQAGVPRFFYRSSLQVYDKNLDENIDETVLPVGGSDAIDKLLSCEQILGNNRSNTFEAVILRCAEIYGNVPFFALGNKIDEALNGYITSNKVQYYPDDYRSCLYVNDACEAIYDVMQSELHKQTIVLVSPEETVSEKEIINTLKGYFEFETEEVAGETKRNPHTYESEILSKSGYNQRYSLAEGIEEISTNVRPMTPKKAEEKKKKKKWLPLVETILVFVIMQLFIYFTSGADFHNIIDLYLLYVLLIAVTHGALWAILAIGLSILGRVTFASQSLLLEGTQYYYWILQLVVIATLSGFVKDKFKRKSIDIEDEKEYLNFELDYYKQLNKNGQEIKNVYEKRLLNYQNSFAKVADIVSDLDSLESQKVIFEAVHVVERTMNSNSVCIYVVDEKSSFARLLASSPELEVKLGKTFVLQDYPSMISAFRDGEVYVNREMDTKLPLLAKALMKDGKIQSILMIYKVEFEDFGLHQVNTFSILSGLIENSLNRALSYFNDTKGSKYYKDTRILVWLEFQKIVDLYCYGEGEDLLEFVLIEVQMKDENLDLLQRTVRNTDFMGRLDKEKYYTLLTNTSLSEADIVIERFHNNEVDVNVIDKKRGKTISDVFPGIV